MQQSGGLNGPRINWHCAGKKVVADLCDFNAERSHRSVRVQLIQLLRGRSC